MNGPARQGRHGVARFISLDIGDYILGHILVTLKEAGDEGFDRIWCSDNESAFKFWDRMGYDMDLDEGVKYFDKHKKRRLQ